PVDSRPDAGGLSPPLQSEARLSDGRGELFGAASRDGQEDRSRLEGPHRKGRGSVRRFGARNPPPEQDKLNYIGAGWPGFEAGPPSRRQFVSRSESGTFIPQLNVRHTVMVCT